PEADGAEADGAEADVRAGTDPLIVAASDAVQVRVDTADGTVPNGLRLDLVDPGAVPEARADAAGSVDKEEPAAARRHNIRPPAPARRSRSTRRSTVRHADPRSERGRNGAQTNPCAART